MVDLTARQRMSRRSLKRRGAVTPLAAILMTVMCGMLAFSIDLGYVALVQAEAQACADAAALAGANAMLDDDRLAGSTLWVCSAARREAAKFAAVNRVGVNVQPVLRPNYLNWDVDGDVMLGRLETPNNLDDPLTFPSPDQYNAVQVTVRFTGDPNARQPFFFARIFGHELFDVTATATAIFPDRVSGFKVKDDGPDSSLIPFAVERDTWIDLIIDGNGQDQWTYGRDSDTVSLGRDGIPEMNMFPEKKKDKGSGSGAGNFGTVDIGDNNNSTNDLRRQIRNGPSEDDLDPYGGKLQLDEDTGTLDLNGDPGVSAGMKDAIEDIVGLPKTIFLYDQITGNGNNTYYRIVGFVGITIIDFQLTGGNKYITVQPSFIADPTAITDGNPGDSYYVGHSVQLAR